MQPDLWRKSCCRALLQHGFVQGEVTGVEQKRHALQLFPAHGPRLVLDAVARHGHACFLVGDGVGLQLRVWRINQAQRHVQLAFQHQLALRACAGFLHVQRHARVALLEQGNYRRHVVACGGHDAHGELTARNAVHLGHFLLEQLRLRQHLQAAFIDHLARIRELHATAFAQQQRAAQLVFKLPDHLADGGLGDVGVFCRTRKAVGAHDFNKVAQGA